MMMTMSFLLLGIITVFIIFVVMYMIISHKSKDIGILKSIGLSVKEILAVFLIFSVFWIVFLFLNPWFRLDAELLFCLQQ